MRGLFIGRFQPLHIGHQKVINFVLKRCDELILIIGSAQYSHTLENPFTAGERYEMLIRVFRKEVKALTLYIIPVPDVHNHNLWVSHVESFTPKFDIVFASNPLTELLFAKRGYTVKPVPVYDRETFSSSKIRQKMVNGEKWESLVPEEISNYMREIKGVERLKALSEWYAGDKRAK
ncbi:MAG: nicotinamide-nucleotide adenylyltransferase [Thermoplasmata archaeon]